MSTICTVCELHAESTFRIEGMDCREEVAILERRFKNLIGLEDFSADLMGQRLHVKYDAARISTAIIADAIADTGMRACLDHEPPIVGSDRWPRIRQVLVWTSGIALAIGLALQWAGAAGLHPSDTIRGVPFLFVISLTAGLGATARKAWTAARTGSFDIHVLMVIAATGAAILGEWSEAAAVVFLFALAQALEARTLDRARHALRTLIDLTPADALVRDADGERRVAVDRIAPGAVIVIRPGEKIPLDGDVVAGQSAVNQAPVTGESLPAEKAPGDCVFAGTVNGRGALEVQVTRLRRDTTLARIIHLVERAQSQRAPAQTLVERFARVYTPAVVGLAAVVAVVPPLLLHGSWHISIYRALVLLVVSCPCALVISTPVSIVAALAAAARKGVLIKGGRHLENTNRVRCVAFDKTGTLTRGVPEVVEVVSLDGVAPASIVAIAAAVEQRSTHPIAQAILDHAASIGVASAPASQVAAIPGRGAEGTVEGRPALVGSHRLFDERHLCTDAIHRRAAAIDAAGRTAVIVARDGRPIGLLAVADRTREASKDAIQLLRAHGVVRVVMLTGDSHGTARAIAAELGVDEFRAELLPEDKVAVIEELRRVHGPVAMVGDGVNDAPALASSDVGIAMGAAGSDSALETADIALMADELLRIPYSFRLSRATVRNIQMNFAISIGLKGVFVIAAVGGMATLWMAVLADTGASVLVIANALRLLRSD